MLSVRRPGIKEALQTPEDREVISTKRGQITVPERAKLEAVAGDSSGQAEADYARLIGLRLSSDPSWKGPATRLAVWMRMPSASDVVHRSGQDAWFGQGSWRGALGTGVFSAGSQARRSRRGRSDCARR
jgi:hypothetical protein